MSSATCPDDRPTIGVEAQPLERFRDVQPEDGGWIIYDADAEDAWIQSDVYYPRANCV